MRERKAFLDHFYFGLFTNIPKVPWPEVYFNYNCPSQVTKDPPASCEVPLWQQRKSWGCCVSQFLSAAGSHSVSQRSPVEMGLSLKFISRTVDLIFLNWACCSPLPFAGVLRGQASSDFLFAIVQIAALLSPAPPGHLETVSAGKKHPECEYPASWNIACCSHHISWKNTTCHEGHS